MSNAQQVNLKNTAERSFKELMKDQPGVDFNRPLIVKVLKDITAQSFGGKNIFEHPLVDHTVNVTYKELEYRNQLSRHEDGQQNKDHYGYEEYLDLFAIHLVSPKWEVGHRARIAIGVYPMMDAYQLAIQFFVDDAQKWVSVPCSTGGVLSTIHNLFPQE